LNFSSRGVQELIDSRDLAQSALKKDEKNANAQNIFDASTKMLSPFNNGQWFGNVSLMTQYDSNIQQLPSGSSNTTATSDTPSTLKENLLAGIGYMSAPLNTFQLVTGYRASYNKNFNSDTKAYEYFTNNVSINLNYRALAKTTYGIKLDSNLVFQNSLSDPTDSTSSYEYQKFNVTLGGGFAIRHQLDAYWRVEGEFNLRNQHYFADSTQKGVNSSFSLSARRTGGDNYFNPGVTILQESNNAQGNLSYYRAYGLGFSNTMNLPNMLILNQSLDFLLTNYSRTSPLRTDANYSLKLGALKFVTPRFTLMADFTYITNYSSIESSYTYNRFTTSAGVGFML
jgi:hypothetical protein